MPLRGIDITGLIDILKRFVCLRLLALTLGFWRFWLGHLSAVIACSMNRVMEIDFSFKNIVFGDFKQIWKYGT